jgi:hypothetical protein
MTDKISPAAAEAAAKQMMDALPRTLAALRVAGHEQARLVHEQRLASARRQLALETLRPNSTGQSIAEAERRVRAREQAVAEAVAMRDAAAVMPVRETANDAVVFGRVIDAHGNAAEGLGVTAKTARGGDIAKTRTDKRGGFSLTVPPGQEFSLVVTASGREVLFRDIAITLAAGETAFRHISLAKPGTKPPSEEPTMPDVVGQTIEVAKLILQRLRLRLGDVAEIETDRAPDGTVLSSRPRAGAVVTPRQIVHLEVARRPRDAGEPTVAVPDLVGRDRQAAEQMLKRAGLSVGKVSEVDTDQAPPGTVLASDPGAGRLVRPDTGIDLEIARKAGTGGTGDAGGGPGGVRFLERLVRAATGETLAGAMPLEPVALMAALRRAEVADPDGLAALLEREDQALKELFGTGSVADTRKLRTRLRAAARKIADG